MLLHLIRIFIPFEILQMYTRRSVASHRVSCPSFRCYIQPTLDLRKISTIVSTEGQVKSSWVEALNYLISFAIIYLPQSPSPIASSPTVHCDQSLANANNVGVANFVDLVKNTFTNETSFVGQEARNKNGR